MKISQGRLDALDFFMAATKKEKKCGQTLLSKRKIISCNNMHGVTYHTHKANDKESDVITSPVITFSLSCKIRQMVTLAFYKVTVVTLVNNTKKC